VWLNMKEKVFANTPGCSLETNGKLWKNCLKGPTAVFFLGRLGFPAPIWAQKTVAIKRGISRPHFQMPPSEKNSEETLRVNQMCARVN